MNFPSRLEPMIALLLAAALAFDLLAAISHGRLQPRSADLRDAPASETQTARSSAWLASFQAGLDSPSLPRR